jgi:2-C-methyl-D-erythritol 4-phosphate cytidylyltransferase
MKDEKGRNEGGRMKDEKEGFNSSLIPHPSSLNVIALIPAAGAGKRMGRETSKQYLEIGGRPILAHTLDVFDRCDAVSEVCLIVPEDDCPYACDLVDGMRFSKPIRVIAGGKERQDSVKNGLDAIYNCDIVMVHDGVRPFVTEAIINRSIEETAKYGATVVAIPAKDTIKSVDAEGNVIETLDRKRLWQIQTPQTFRYEILKEAFDKAYKEGFYGTDDAALVERLGCKVKVVEGSYDNIKITTQEDLVIAEAILKSRGGK